MNHVTMVHENLKRVSREIRQVIYLFFNTRVLS